MFIGLQPSLACLFLYWLPAKRGVPGYTKLLMTVGIIGFIGYLSLQQGCIEILQNCQQTSWQTAGMCGVAGLLLLFGIPALPIFFLPALLAFKTRARRKRSVLLINLLPLPFNTFVAMLWLWTGFKKETGP